MVLLARRRVKDDNCRVSQSDRFAHLVGNLLEAMGYRTRVSPEGPDKGIDIVVFRDELGLHPPIIKVQVKSGEGNVGALRRRWCSRRWAGRRVYRTSAARAAFG